MDALSQLLRAQAHNNAWANHRLLAACAQLSQADFEARRTSFFPSIKATLNHLLTVDWYYLDAIERSLAGRPANLGFEAFFDPEEPYASCAELRAEQAACDARLIALCRPLVDEAVERTVVGIPRRLGVMPEPLARVLAHLFQHQIHHRGQVHAMLAGTAVAPPQLDDFFLASDAPLRVADFAALGFDEAAIWPARPDSPRSAE
ncbi:MAG TPA: DinB family protein [Burkholderiaceae bacterium]|nr:DinB family protein [Burkholderiaceae bacterium]